MAIRYDKKFNSEIARTVKRFNDKVKRLEKKNAEFIPTRVTVRELKNTYDRRSDLKIRLRELAKFSEKGIEKTIITPGGVRQSQYNIVILERQRQRLLRYYNREIKRLEAITPTVYGTKQVYDLRLMGSDELSNLKARRDSIFTGIKYLSPESFKTQQKKIEKQRDWLTLKQWTLYQNLDDIFLNSAYRVGFEKEKIQEIKDKLGKLSFSQFIELWDTERSLKDIVNRYGNLFNRNGELDEIAAVDLREKFENFYNNLDRILEDYA